MASKPLELFWIAGSPFSWRVMLTLETKQIPYIPRLLQASQRDHKKPDFLALNPRGKVPTLRDGDFVLYESIAIMQYLEERHSARPMFGRTAHETAAIWRAISEFSSYLQLPLLRISGPLLTGKSARKLMLRAAGKDEGSQFDLGLLPLKDHYPRLAAWMEQIERLPGYERTYPPHWRQ